MNLSTKLFTFLGGIGLVIVSTYMWLGYVPAEKRFEELLLQNRITQLKTAWPALATATWTVDKELAEIVIHTILTGSDIRYFFIFDEEGVFQGFEQKNGMIQRTTLVPKITPPKPGEPFRLRRAKQPNALNEVVGWLQYDLQRPNTRVGWIYCAFHVDFVAEIAALKDRAIWVAIALFLSVVLLCALFMQKTIIKPLKLLERSARGLARQEYTTLLHWQSSDEIGSLFAHFNIMACNTRTHVENLKYVAQELAQARDRAEKASAAKSDFLAHVSHELRTPLSGVLGMTELLAQTPLDATQSRYLSIMQESGNALFSVINSLLDFSRLDAQRMPIHLEAFSLPELLEKTLETFEYAAQSKNLSLSLHIAENLPRVLFGDAGKIRQILINFIGNAMKFTPSGSVEVSATLAEERINGFLARFSVKDSGIGIPKEMHQKIFEPFTQVTHPTQRSVVGSGLGLAIAARLVDLLGGEITVESTEGEGSTFTFTTWFRFGPEGDPVYRNSTEEEKSS